MFRHWNRWVRSDSVDRQLVIERLSKGGGVFRHLSIWLRWPSKKDGDSIRRYWRYCSLRI